MGWSRELGKSTQMTVKRNGRRFGALAALVLLAACARPISDPSTLNAIKAEADILDTRSIPSQGWAEVPKNEWPVAIASLGPERVAVYQWGVSILIRPGFDGGWGYDIPRKSEQPPMPLECYSEPSPGVFWHSPC